MNKVTIISSSNRNDNKTRFFADHCMQLLEDQGIDVSVCSLEQLPPNLSEGSVYDEMDVEVASIVEKYLNGVEKLLFVVPEYNGSFPGILKLLIDAIPPKHFRGKKAGLIGVSSGKSGNVRGLDHLTGILNYIKVNVHFHKLPIGSIDSVLSDGKITDAVTQKRLSAMIQEFLDY